jgi:hypothetical protein
MNLATAESGPMGLVRNFCRRINMSQGAFLVETELFPKEALIAYSAYNLGQHVSQEQHDAYFSAHRGGSQGDYREGIQEKIANIVDCLIKFPSSKRAVLTIPNKSNALHTSDEDAKCLREIHFYLDMNFDSSGLNVMTLNATVLMRAQAAEIFPKNVHFIGMLMETIADAMNASADMEEGCRVEVGELFYLATTLVSVRW